MDSNLPARATPLKSLFWTMAIILAVLFTSLLVMVLLNAPRADSNTLAVGTAARVDSLDIPIQEAIELDFKSRAEIMKIRMNAVQKFPQLLAGRYRPSNAVFGQIVDGLPWWGLEGQVHYGPGIHSIEGRSEEARFIVNPYLLAAPDFLPATTMDPQSAVTFYCVPRNLRWQPRQAYAEVTYHAACLNQPGHTPYFDLIAYNARDFNLEYVFVSYADSVNLEKYPAPREPYANPQFIHRGNSCGYSGGCNNMSPETPEIDGIRILGFPASLRIRFWKEAPASTEAPADMTFTIHFK